MKTSRTRESTLLIVEKEEKKIELENKSAKAVSRGAIRLKVLGVDA